MSIRAIILGLLGAVLIAAGGFINNRVLRLESVDAGHQIPVIVIGLLFFGVAVVNPVLFGLRKRLAFRPAEFAVIVLLLMISCSIPGRGLLEQFISTVSMPNHWQRQYPGWRKNNLIQYCPPQMLAGGTEYDSEVLEGFVVGGRMRNGEWASFTSAVPWGKWATPMATWVPLIVLLTIASVSLALVVHRQWATNERLRYPIAEFTTALIQREPHRAVAPVLRNRLFWIGLSILLGIHVINGLYRWFPEKMIQVPLSFDFTAIRRKWPMILKIPNWAGHEFTAPRLFPIVVGFSFFLSSEISLSLGLTQFLAIPISMALMTAGVDLATDYDTGGPQGWHRAGAYAALAVILVYIGRRYYWDLLKASLRLRRPKELDGYAVWAFRFLILSTVGMVWIITSLGLDWTLSILVVGLMMLMFLCMSRISAETGLFFIQAGWLPFGVLMGMLGSFAMGPAAIVISGMFCAVLCIDPSQGLMPYFVNALRICDNVKVSPGRAGISTVAVYVICLAVAIPVCIWAYYNWGSNPMYGWSHQRVPTMAFRPAQLTVDRLKNSGQLEESESLGPVRRLLTMRPKEYFLWSFLSGVALVLLFSVLRLRYAWWPLHPVLFLAWTTYPLRVFCYSFMLGWILKTIITRLGGHSAYRKAMPLMIGLITAEVLGALVFIVVGAVYHAATGLQPVNYTIFPR